MKHILFTILLFLSFFSFSQCNTYQAFESFGSAAIPTQGGTWSQNSMLSTTNGARTGARAIAFNGSGDWIRTPQLASPGVLSFWYRRSTNTTAWTLIVETSPDNVNWTTRSTITNATATYQQHTLNLSALGLTNIYVRFRDARGSGAHERYIEDMSWTSTNVLDNSLVPFPLSGNCTQTIGSNYTIIDQGGPNETYNNNMDQTMLLQPADIGKKIELSFSAFSLETAYDTLFVYNGPNTASPLLGSYTGSVTPTTLTSSSAGGELTLRFKSDVSNVGTWVGFTAIATQITPLPVELLYFDGVKYPTWNLLKWATASEWNSMNFIIERSIDGITWDVVTTKSAAGNSNQQLNYFYLDNIITFTINYYRLIQNDVDGQFVIYGPIAIDNTRIKKIIRRYNLSGQVVDETATGLIIEVFDDGTMQKIIK